MLIPNKHSGYQAGIRLYPGGGKGGSSAPPPDPALIAAQIKSMGIQDNAIQKLLANQDEMAPLQKAQMQFGLDSAKTAYDQSQQDRTWMLGRRDMLSTSQDQMAKEAADFNTDARREELAGQATADVNSAASSARGQAERALDRRGVNPASGHALDTANQIELTHAAMGAGAANNARTAARSEGRALNDRVTNSLAGYPAMAAGSTGAGATYGASGIGIANTGVAGINSGLTAAGSMAGAMGSNATSMYGAQASFKNSQDQIASNNDPMKTLIGAAGGMGAAYITGSLAKPSDIRLKTDIKKIGSMDDGLSIYIYRYKSGGDFQVGVMAHEVAALRPDAYIKGGAGDGFDAVDYSKL